MSRRAYAIGTPSHKMLGSIGRLACILPIGIRYTVCRVRVVRRMSHYAVFKLVLFTTVVVTVSGVTASCTNGTGIHAREQTLVSNCPTVEQVKIALQGTGHQGILLALHGLQCSGISPGEEINVDLGERFARDPASMQFVLQTGKMTPNQVGDSLSATPYRLVDKLCAAVREIDKRRRIVKATIRDPKARNILVQELRVNAGYERSVCQ